MLFESVAGFPEWKGFQKPKQARTGTHTCKTMVHYPLSCSRTPTLADSAFTNHKQLSCGLYLCLLNKSCLSTASHRKKTISIFLFMPLFPTKYSCFLTKRKRALSPICQRQTVHCFIKTSKMPRWFIFFSWIIAPTMGGWVTSNVHKS